MSLHGLSERKGMTNEEEKAAFHREVQAIVDAYKAEGYRYFD